MNKYVKKFTFIIITISILVGCERNTDKSDFDNNTFEVWKENTEEQLKKHYIDMNSVNMGGFVNHISETPDAIHTYYGILVLEHLELESKYDYNKFANFSKLLLTETLINNNLSDDLFEELHIIYLLDKLNISITKEHLDDISINLDSYINLHINDLQEQRYSIDNKEDLILQQYISSIYLNYLIIKNNLELSVPGEIKKDITSNFLEVLERSKEYKDDKSAKGIYILSSIDKILNLNKYKINKESLIDLYSYGGFKAHPTEVSEPDLISTSLILQNEKSFEVINQKEIINFIEKHRNNDLGGYNFYGNEDFSLYLTGESILIINLLNGEG